MAKKILSAILAIFLLSGCSSYKETNNLAIVLGFGIDYDMEKKEYEVTLQLVNPNGVAKTSGGQAGVPVININGKGRTLTEAARNASKSFSRVTIYSHLTLIVLSEEFAREVGINFILDTFERDAKVRTNSLMVIAKGQAAKELLSVIPVMDSIPATSLVKKIESTSRVLGQNPNNFVHKVIGGLTSKGQEPVINGASSVGDLEKGAGLQNIESLKDTFIKIDGIGIFRNGVLVDWMNGDKAKSLQIISNELKSTEVTLACGEQGTLSAITRLKATKTNVSYQNGKARISVKVSGNGFLTEMLCNLQFDKPEVLKEIENSLQKEIEQNVLEGIRFAQDKESDIFGFGEMLHRSNPKQWKKAEDNWNQTFADATVEVEADIYLYGTGMRTKAYPF
ncbi:Ger(x)C family spore germination protein [Bacillus salacetis]|uniref:Ger(x)C family spore germination protein n=1 Tax=Bacillus salacetis TaxID=2315464 RepID=UPI003B9F3616